MTPATSWASPARCSAPKRARFPSRAEQSDPAEQGAASPLPEKFHGLTDQETRYRQRYVDLIVNPEVKDTFVKRSQILREHARLSGRQGLPGGGHPHSAHPSRSARPPVPSSPTTTRWTWTWCLRIETELYLKRLIVGGMDRVYEVGRIFRNEGMDTKHNPEFTTIELYQAYTDYHGMMDLVEEMMKTVAQNGMRQR